MISHFIPFPQNTLKKVFHCLTEEKRKKIVYFFIKEERKCATVLVYDVCGVHTHTDKYQWNQKRNRQKKTCVNRESSKSEKEITKTFFFLLSFETVSDVQHVLPTLCVCSCVYRKFQEVLFCLSQNNFFRLFHKKNILWIA